MENRELIENMQKVMFDKQTGTSQSLVWFAELLSNLAKSADQTAEKNLRITEDNLRIADKNLKLQDRVLGISVVLLILTFLQVFLSLSNYR